MADDYQAALGWSNAAGLALLDPQPHTEGVWSSNVVASLSGELYADGIDEVELHFSFITPEQWASLLTQLGLSSLLSNQITLRTNTGGDRTTFANYNAIIHRPVTPRFRLGFYRDVTFTAWLWAAL